MTVVASWVREINKAKKIYELIMVSDSRLNSGMFWDSCPKIMRFERGDSVLGFAGNTAFSYPFMLQINNIMTEYSKISRGAINFQDLTGHFIRTMNAMTSNIDNQIIGGIENKIEPYTNEYIFAGLDWHSGNFVINTISCVPHQRGEIKSSRADNGCIIKTNHGTQELTYDNTQYHFGLNKEKDWMVPLSRIYFENFDNHFGQIGIIGDKREELISILREILYKKYGRNYEACFDSKFDMEPYDALCELLRREAIKNPTSTVGGAPQMVKVYQYMKSGTIGVYWPERNSNNPYENRTLLGRNLLSYEETDYWFWDQKCNRSFPCRDGMNKYVDMFEELRFRYTARADNHVEVAIISGEDSFFGNCHFKIKSRVNDLTYNSRFKVVLSYDKQDNKEHLYPMWDLKEFYVPSKDVFTLNQYEVKGKMVDMFQAISFRYDKWENKSFRITLIKDDRYDYSKYCKFEIDLEVAECNQEFSVSLTYDVKGIVDCGIEPYIYKKRYKIPSEREMKEYFIRKYKIQKLVDSLAIRLTERSNL